MILRDILAIVTSYPAQEHVIAFGQQLAFQNTGRLTAALVNWMPAVVPVDGFVVGPFYSGLVEETQQYLAEGRKKLEASLARVRPEACVESYLLEMAAADSELGQRARHADISIITRLTVDDRSSGHTVLEAVLFDSGRPVVVVPPGWKPGPIGKNVLVAWKPTREATRAVADADEFLMQAQNVSVVTVDAKPSHGYGEQPGADITAHLAFRGAKVKLFNVDSTGRSETRAILDQARSVGADLIVMGGYGRARISEMIFGGVTREILKTTEVPVFMSH